MSDDSGCEISLMILDASVLLAVLQNEPGTADAMKALEEGAMSAANFSEVAAKLQQHGVPVQDVRSILESFDLNILPVDTQVAYLAANLVSQTQKHGLGLGDRLCLATAIFHQQPVLTADRAWLHVSYDGLEVQLLR